MACYSHHVRHIKDYKRTYFFEEGCSHLSHDCLRGVFGAYEALFSFVVVDFLLTEGEVLNARCHSFLELLFAFD